MVRPVKDEVGKRYGRLVVLGRGERSNQGKATWLCRCDCGSMTNVAGISLRRGLTRSCGCLHIARATEASTTHGMRSHPAYTSYSMAKQRCNNPSNRSYADYGGRGIQFKFASFEQFWKELGPTWKEGLSIDRKDNNGHYEPGNCRWATRTEQTDNRRNTVKVSVRGEHLTLRQVSTRFGVSYGVAHYRYHKYGQNFEDWPQHLRS